MSEGIRSFISKKLEQVDSVIRPTDGLLLLDDPTLHRLIKQRIRQELSSKEGSLLAGLHKLYKKFTEDEELDENFVQFLTQEVELQQIDFLTQQEKLRKPVFEKILKKIAALDFRDFVSSSHDKVSVYDTEVITPQVSWFVEQVFHNLPGFFNFLNKAIEEDDLLASSQADIVRNIFILGYAHGFFNEDNQELQAAKDYLTYSIIQSDATENKIKDYPICLRKIAETNKKALVSPRLEQLKQHWTQQFARRWLLLSRVDEASPSVLSETTLKQVSPTLPMDRRLFENVAVARKMDRRNFTQAIWTGADRNPQESSHEIQQAREEMRLHADITQSQRSAVIHMRDCLRLYQGNNKEVFQDGQKISEKWLSYKMVAEQILQKLVVNFSLLQKTKVDKQAFDQSMGEIVGAMLDVIAVATKQTNVKIEDFFGTDFMSLSRIEQLSLLTFTALSFIERETSTIRLAIQILDKLIVPKLDQHFDSHKLGEVSDTSQSLQLSEFDLELFQKKSARARGVFNLFSTNDGLLSIDGIAFKTLLKEKKQLLGNVSKIYSFFAKVVGENWKEHATLKPGILGLFFALTAFASGYINFNLSQELLEKSIGVLYSENPSFFLLKLLPVFLTGAAGALFLGQQARSDFKKLTFSSSKFTEQIRYFTNGGWRQVATLLFFSIYSMSSTFPLWEDQARDAWQSMQDRWEEMFKNEETESSANTEQNFWEDRNPEAKNPRDLEKVEKTKWGKIVVGEAVFGKDIRSPVGFINTFSVSPTIRGENGVQEFVTEKVVDKEISPLLIFAQDVVIANDTLLVTMDDGSSFRQEAYGTDLIVYNGPLNGSDGFVKFLDRDRFIEKIIVIPKPEIASGFTPLSFASYQSFKYASQEDLNQIARGIYDFFVVYRSKQDEITLIDEYKIDLSENFAYWQAYHDERSIVLDILEEENPEAAALYAKMMSEQEGYWTAYARGGDTEAGVYSEMIQRQVSEYNDFVHSNHVYSLRYNPNTNYTEQYPNIGVMLDVMSLDRDGYYCATAHLAAQQWFLSLGVPMDGLYGYHVYNDASDLNSRIAHVQTGLYGLVYDFTPSTPNPGEDLSSLNFDPQEAVSVNDSSNVTVAEKNYAAVMELLKKFASKENTSVLVFLLSVIGIGYSVKLGADRIRGKNGKGQIIEQIRDILPDSEVEIRTLVSALIQLFNLISDAERLVLEGEVDREKNLQIIREVLSLASRPINASNEAAVAMGVNPEIFSLLRLSGISSESADQSDTNRVIEFWKKLSSNKEQVVAILSDFLLVLDKISLDLQKSHELKKQVLEKDIRKLQRQLFRARRTENQLYQGYGSLLERTRLLTVEQLNERRKTSTADFFILDRSLEQKQKELQQLVAQSRLLPRNVRNLKKVLQFILNAADKREDEI